MCHITCGEDFTVFLTLDGGVFTCGVSEYGQTGHGTKNDELVPRKVSPNLHSFIRGCSNRSYKTWPFAVGNGTNGQHSKPGRLRSPAPTLPRGRQNPGLRVRSPRPTWLPSYGFLTCAHACNLHAQRWVACKCMLPFANYQVTWAIRTVSIRMFLYSFRNSVPVGTIHAQRRVSYLLSVAFLIYQVMWALEEIIRIIVFALVAVPVPFTSKDDSMS